MGFVMTTKSHNVLLPLSCPDTAALRNAQAAILTDIHRDTGETYAQIGARLGSHENTVANWAKQLTDMGALTIAKIGAIYGKEYVRPYETLYGGDTETGTNPLPELTKAVAAIAGMDKGTPKQKLDTLPDLKAAASALAAYISEIERHRLKSVA